MSKTNGTKCVAILDNIRSIYNVGSIFRTAEGAGISHLYLCGITPTPTHPKLAKTALGAEQTLAWSTHRNAFHLVQTVKEHGFFLIGIEGGVDALCFSAYAPSKNIEKIAFIVGNEKCGVDPDILALCDTIYEIPMMGQKQSLNVTVAFGIAAYTFLHGTPFHGG